MNAYGIRAITLITDLAQPSPVVDDFGMASLAFQRQQISGVPRQ